MHINVHCALFIIAKLWNQPKSSSSVWVNKEDLYIYTMKYFSAIKKKWKLSVCRNMGGFGEYYIYWNKSGKDK